MVDRMQQESVAPNKASRRTPYTPAATLLSTEVPQYTKINKQRAPTAREIVDLMKSSPLLQKPYPGFDLRGTNDLWQASPSQPTYFLPALPRVFFRMPLG